MSTSVDFTGTAIKAAALFAAARVLEIKFPFSASMSSVQDLVN